MNVATVLVASRLTDPPSVFPPESFSVNPTVPSTTAWENVAVGATETENARRPGAGRDTHHRRRRRPRRLRVHHVEPVVN